MSDPVTQAEIEDVLSSIRRLVSEDGRSTPRAVATALSVPDQPAQPSADLGAAGNAGQQLAQADQAKPAPRLVLTPALRVRRFLTRRLTVSGRLLQPAWR